MKQAKHDTSPRCPRCEQIISTCHPLLQEWFWKAKSAFPDMHTSCGFRDEEAQLVAFNNGASRVKWPNSKHNKTPALAMDLFQIRADKVAAWPVKWFAQINAYLKAHKCPLAWGGDWARFKDSPHWEMKS